MKPENIVNSFSEYKNQVEQMSEAALTTLAEEVVDYANADKKYSKKHSRNVMAFLECEVIPGRALIDAIRTLRNGPVRIVSEKIAVRLGKLMDTNPELWEDPPEEDK